MSFQQRFLAQCLFHGRAFGKMLEKFHLTEPMFRLFQRAVRTKRPTCCLGQHNIFSALLFYHTLPAGRVELPSERYECSVLTVELRRQSICTITYFAATRKKRPCALSFLYIHYLCGVDEKYVARLITWSRGCKSRSRNHYYLNKMKYPDLSGLITLRRPCKSGPRNK